MICLDNTDVIEGGADVDAKVDYTIHGLVGTTFTQLAAGVLGTTLTTVLCTAGAAISVVSIILVNTHTSAVAVTLTIDPADGGNPRYIIPKAVSLGAGYSLHTDGARISIMNPTGALVYTYLAHTHDGDTLQLDGVNSDGGAFPFTTSGLVTFSQNITFAGQLGFPATANPSADPNTLDDYQQNTYTPTILFGGAAVGVAYNAGNTTGKYTITGNFVVFTARVTLTNKGSSNGVLTLVLPCVTGATYLSAFAIDFGNISFADQLRCLSNAGLDTAYFRETSAAGVSSDITDANCANNSYFTVSGVYFI